MVRTRPKPIADHERLLEPASPFCAECGKRMQIAYHNKRHLLTLQGRLALTMPVRVCRNADCRAQKKPVRPWEEGALALPQSECGLDLIAFVGHGRYAKHQSLLQIHQALGEREVDLCERSVCNLLHRYEELVALNVARALSLLKAQGRVVLAIDGLQPDKGHEVLWVLRDCLSGTIKRVRGIRPLEHTLAERDDDEAQVIRGYCLAVRGALTDDGQPPLEAPGLRLQERLTAITTSLSDVEKKGACPSRSCD